MVISAPFSRLQHPEIVWEAFCKQAEATKALESELCPYLQRFGGEMNLEIEWEPFCKQV